MFLKFLILSLSIAFSSACIDVCRGRPGNHFAVNPRGCAWYFRCNVGQEAQEGRCPGDFVFSYERQMCDYRENVQCEDPEIRTECPPTGIDVIKHPHVCSKYVVCIDGFQEDRECPNGLHFSSYDKKCVDPTLAECSNDREFCTSINGDDDFIQFKVPNPRACDQFYLCWNNQEQNAIGAATFRCNYGLHVNPNNFLCELPETAGCDSSQHPAPPQYPGVNLNFDCPNDGIFAHPDSCRFWFFCQGGQSSMFQCAQSTYFNDVLKRCDLGPCASSMNESPLSLPSDENTQEEIEKNNKAIEIQQRELLKRVLGKLRN